MNTAQGAIGLCMRCGGYKVDITACAPTMGHPCNCGTFMPYIPPLTEERVREIIREERIKEDRI